MPTRIPPASPVATKQRRRIIRLLALGALFVGLLAVGKHYGLQERLAPDHLRAMILSAGVWGIALYVVIFSLGELVHVPGLVFVSAGVLAYGRVWGGALGWGASLVSVSVTFFVARAIGGRPLADTESPRVRRLMARLDTRPVATIFLLRTFFVLSSWLNYGLALSGVRYRDYILGSAMGLAVPVALATLFFDALLRFYAWT